MQQENIMQTLSTTEYVIVRQVYSVTAGKSVFEVLKVFTTKVLGDALVMLQTAEQEYPEDQVSLYIRLS